MMIGGLNEWSLADSRIGPPVGVTVSPLSGCTGAWWADGTWACSCGTQDWEGDPEYAERYAEWERSQ